MRRTGPGGPPPRQVAEVRITAVNADGDGLASLDGRTIAVPRTIPGERVEVGLPARPGSGADLLRVLTPSPHRVRPRCGHFGLCGSCAWQHITYAEQLRLKQRALQRLLDDALGAAAPPVLPPLPTPPVPGDDGPWHFRNKVHFVFGPGARGRSLIMGHFRRGSRVVVPVAECPVHAEEGNRVAFAMRDALQEAAIPAAAPDGSGGLARHIVVRVAEHDHAWLATLVVVENAKVLRRVTADFLRAIEPGASPAAGDVPRWGYDLNVHDRPGSFLFGRATLHLAGAAEVRELIAGVAYVATPAAFFQTNVRAADVLVRTVLASAAPERGDGQRVLDLYSGAGFFALPLAQKGCTVTAVEENREAMASARKACRLNRIPERLFRALVSRIEDTTARLTPRGDGVHWHAVVLDPPREGCPPAVLHWVLRRARPPRVVYVSCNPEALARDLRQAAPAGYRVSSVQPIDMFPHTAHVESVAVLDRQA